MTTTTTTTTTTTSTTTTTKQLPLAKLDLDELEPVEDVKPMLVRVALAMERFRRISMRIASTPAIFDLGAAEKNSKPADVDRDLHGIAGRYVLPREVDPVFGPMWRRLDLCYYVHLQFDHWLLGCCMEDSLESESENDARMRCKAMSTLGPGSATTRSAMGGSRFR